MSRIAVVDTNVVVAGIITGHAGSPVAHIVDAMLAARFSFAVSEALLAEYRDVLARPAIFKRSRLTPGEIEQVTVEIAHHAIVLVPAGGPPAPDSGDQFLFDLLAARDDLVLVTGNAALVRDRSLTGRVLAPRDFAASLPPPAQ